RRYPDLPPQRLRVIPNGYDEADFAAVPYRHPQHLRITHSGSLFYRRIPHAFFEVLREMLETQPAFAARLRLCFAGRVDEAALALLRRPPFDRVAEVLGQLTHAGSVELLRRSRLLLLCTGTDAQSRNLVTGKVYEYLAAGPPILALAPRDGDAARLVERTGAGWAHDPDDREGIRRRLNELWRIECEREAGGGTPPDHPPLFGLRRKEPEIALFTRREQTRRLTELFADGCAG
ncbi:MAG: hypothetical protein V1774_10815, partial [Candidatus Eisenbacteria bacterium]